MKLALHPSWHVRETIDGVRLASDLRKLGFKLTVFADGIAQPYAVFADDGGCTVLDNPGSDNARFQYREANIRVEIDRDQ
jgi:hypothetical protein